MTPFPVRMEQVLNVPVRPSQHSSATQATPKHSRKGSAVREGPFDANDGVRNRGSNPGNALACN